MAAKIVSVLLIVGGVMRYATSSRLSTTSGKSYYQLIVLFTARDDVRSNTKASGEV